MGSRWGGRKVMALRAKWRTIIATDTVPCSKCGMPIAPGMAWDLDHVHARAAGGDPWDLDLVRPAHRSCNRRAGQAYTTALRKARARRRAPPDSYPPPTIY